MPDSIASVTALILERPTCMSCLAEKSGYTSEEARIALEVIETVVTVHRDPSGHCHACGSVGLVVYSNRLAQ